MDARIGQLMRNGSIVHYAFINGYSQPAFEGTLEQVEVALGLRAAVETEVVAEKKTKGDLVEYTVHVTHKYPAWNQVGGFDVTVWARSKAEANKIARRELVDSIWGEGPVYFKATRKDQ